MSIFNPNNFRKRLIAMGGVFALPGVASAITLFWAIVVIAVVVAVGVGIAYMLKRLSEIPPIDRERQIRAGSTGTGDIWPYYTNHGLPPQISVTNGNIPANINFADAIVNPANPAGPLLDYYEIDIIEPTPVIIVSTCTNLTTGWNFLASVGEGENSTGFTNEFCEISLSNGNWSILPTANAMRTRPYMFWKSQPK